MSAQFAKEELVAIANDMGYEVNEGAPPAKTKMRVGIRWKTGMAESEKDTSGGAFTKDELCSIADTVGATVGR